MWANKNLLYLLMFSKFLSAHYFFIYSSFIVIEFIIPDLYVDLILYIDVTSISSISSSISSFSVSTSSEDNLLSSSVIDTIKSCWSICSVFDDITASNNVFTSLPDLPLPSYTSNWLLNIALSCSDRVFGLSSSVSVVVFVDVIFSNDFKL